MAIIQRASQGPLAAIDMGSNSYHLLIAEWQQGQLLPGFVAVERVQTALLMRGDRITEEAEERVLSCLERFRAIAREHGCGRIVAVGTSALRQASNTGQLLGKAEAVLGWPVVVLSGEDEARLIYRAVSFARGNPERRMLVLDIGGGSTEIIRGHGSKIEDLESLALGCVSSLKRHFSDGMLNRTNFEACVQAARQQLLPLVPRFRMGPEVDAVGCSGTALAIVRLLGLAEISLRDLERLRDQLLGSFARISEVSFEGLDSNRSGLLAPGLAVLIALVDSFSISRMITVDVALREGVALAWYLGDDALRQELSPGIAI